MKLDVNYKRLTNPLINDLFRGFYITNGTQLGHSNFSDAYQGKFNDNSLTVYKKLASVTEDQLIEIEKEIADVIPHNQELITKNKEQVDLAVTVLSQLTNEKIKKYLKKESTFYYIPKPHYSNWYNTDFLTRKDQARKMVEFAKKAVSNYEESKSKQSKQEKEQEQLLTDAIKYLLDNGKSIGTDFTVNNAIECADELAYTLEVEKQRSQGGYINFSGDDYCEDCQGWDMSSHRCSCGNRRVSFTTGYGHSFKQPWICAEAH